MAFLTKTMVAKSFPSRPEWSKKGDFGRVLVVGGSKVFAGTPSLVARAALRTGADLVHVFAPTRAADVAAQNPNVITWPQRGDFLHSWHLHDFQSLAKQCQSIVLGNGMGRRKETEQFFRAALEFEKPTVIDADGLHFLKKEHVRPHMVLTPHTYEFFILTGVQLTNELPARQAAVVAAAKELGCTIVVKGHVDIITNGEKTILNKTGNVYMTKGGTGDTLAGVCGALLARGLPPLEAAAAAAWLNGAAGDLVAKQKGAGLLATEVADAVCEVLP